MRIRTRIFLGFLVIVGVGFYFLIDWIVDDLTPRYRESTEEPLVDSARLLASIAAISAVDGKVDVELFRRAFDDVYSRAFAARIYDFVKTEVDFRVYITDELGRVIFDSDRGRDEGADYSRWRDVSMTLSGDYGARTSRDTPAGPTASVLYVAAPIIVNGRIIGVLTVGKPTANANMFIDSAKRKIIVAGVWTAAAVLITALVVSAMLTRPIQALTEYAKAVKEGKRVQLPPLAGTEIKELGAAFEEMRDALEGKQYVENYVQTLTHEIKSPLSAIQGAVELLNEEMPVERREQFFRNIRSETERIKDIVEKMLLLSSLETRKSAQDKEPIDLNLMLEEIRASMLPLLESKHLELRVDAPAGAKLRGERFLLRHALVNLLQNAIEFSPQGAEVEALVEVQPSAIDIKVRDRGPGVPDYALERVFERFYSISRPDTGKKSSGLGLSLVQEVASLHGGSVTLGNRPEGGAEAVLSLPRAER